MPHPFRVATAACVVLLLASLPAQAALPRYDLFDLGALIGPGESFGARINDAGQVIGVRNGDQAFLYTPGSGVADMATLIGAGPGVPTHALGLNNLGHVTGGLGDTGFIYRGGAGTQYLPAGTFAPARINDAGVYVGSAYDGMRGYAYQFTPGSGYQELPLYQIVQDLNEAGQVAGWQIENGVDTSWDVAARHDAGGVDLLGNLGGLYSRSNALNNAGDVVGYAESAGGAQHAFLYTDGGGMVDLDTRGLADPDARSFATAVNDDGLIGGAFSASLVDGLHPFLSDGASGLLDLNSLLQPSAAGWTILSVSDINNAGQIVGTGEFGGTTRAFILNAVAAPVPEPSSWAAMLVGVALLRVRRRLDVG